MSPNPIIRLMFSLHTFGDPCNRDEGDQCVLLCLESSFTLSPLSPCQTVCATGNKLVLTALLFVLSPFFLLHFLSGPRPRSHHCRRHHRLLTSGLRRGKETTFYQTSSNEAMISAG